MNEDFARPLGPAIPKPAPAAPQPVQIKPGIWQAPDGKLETRMPTQGPRMAPTKYHCDTCEDTGTCYGPIPTNGGYREGEMECPDCDATSNPKREDYEARSPLPVVPNALGDGWIDHDGSPCPVAKGTLLQVQLRNGLVRDAAALEMCGFGSAQQWVDDTYPEDTIVAYRLIP
jgi:hypothetical protein